MYEFGTKLAVPLAIVSMTLVGVMMTASALLPQEAEKYKKQVPNIIIGIIIVNIAAWLIGKF